MALAATELSRSAAHGARLAGLIKDQCRAINARLRRHPNLWGSNSLRYELPTLFGLPGLDRGTAQLIIYDRVLAYFVALGYEAYLEHTGARWFLLLAWQTSLGADEAAAMKARIAARLIGPAEAKAVQNRAAGPSPDDPRAGAAAAPRRPFVLAAPKATPLRARGGLQAPPARRPPAPKARDGPSQEEANLLGIPLP